MLGLQNLERQSPYKPPPRGGGFIVPYVLYVYVYIYTHILPCVKILLLHMLEIIPRD